MAIPARVLSPPVDALATMCARPPRRRSNRARTPTRGRRARFLFIARHRRDRDRGVGVGVVRLRVGVRLCVHRRRVGPRVSRLGGGAVSIGGVREVDPRRRGHRASFVRERREYLMKRPARRLRRDLHRNHGHNYEPRRRARVARRFQRRRCRRASKRHGETRCGQLRLDRGPTDPGNTRESRPITPPPRTPTEARSRSRRRRPRTDARRPRTTTGEPPRSITRSAPRPGSAFRVFRIVVAHRADDRSRVRRGWILAGEARGDVVTRALARGDPRTGDGAARAPRRVQGRRVRRALRKPLAVAERRRARGGHRPGDGHRRSKRRGRRRGRGRGGRRRRFRFRFRFRVSVFVPFVFLFLVAGGG